MSFAMFDAREALAPVAPNASAFERIQPPPPASFNGPPPPMFPPPPHDQLGMLNAAQTQIPAGLSMPVPFNMFLPPPPAGFFPPFNQPNAPAAAATQQPGMAPPNRMNNAGRQQNKPMPRYNRWVVNQVCVVICRC